MANDDKRGMTWAYLFRYAIFTLLSSVVLLEIILALLYPAPPFEAISITSKDAVYQLSPNKDLFYVPSPSKGDFNSGGDRGPLLPHNRSKDKKRFVFVGDSVVEGSWSQKR